MKATELVSMWGSLDNTRLTSKQVSFRLPVHVAAKIAALCDLYPTKTRTQIVGDLLSSALGDVEKALPAFKGERWGSATDDNGGPLFMTVGPMADFRHRTNVHYVAFEKELGMDEPAPFYPGDLIWEEG
ncbi:hypothetical protein [Actimicrobium antarcticum]|uniref:Uncharacterized protein n=1 Tax=Actimicrobium antarcticum TaxID=1051899 RepID=A0ABP7TMQ9_9BURK